MFNNVESFDTQTYKCRITVIVNVSSWSEYMHQALVIAFEHFNHLHGKVSFITNFISNDRHAWHQIKGIDCKF